MAEQGPAVPVFWDYKHESWQVGVCDATGSVRRADTAYDIDGQIWPAAAMPPQPVSQITVGRLRAALDGLPDDMPVVVAKDEEGNDHSPLAEVDQAMYAAHNTWSGDVYPTPEQLAVLVDQPGSTWDPADDAPPADAVRVLLLIPVN